MKHEESTFLSGAASSCGYIFFSKEIDSIAQTSGSNSIFCFFDEDEEGSGFFGFESDAVSWTSISFSLAKPTENGAFIISVSPKGDYFEFDFNTTDESIGKIPGFSGNLRRLSNIDNFIFACGMGRQILLRHGLNIWESIGPGERPNDLPVVGFEAMTGFSRNEIYAVGWNGEIWCRENQQWRQIDSPTSKTLSAICCGEDGFLYAVGHQGSLLKGRGDQWEVIDTGRAENLKDVVARNEKLYVVTDFEILVLGEEGLEPDEEFLDEDRPATCLHLLPAKDGVISMGTKDVFVKQDGSPWKRLV